MLKMRGTELDRKAKATVIVITLQSEFHSDTVKGSFRALPRLSSVWRLFWAVVRLLVCVGSLGEDR